MACSKASPSCHHATEDFNRLLPKRKLSLSNFSSNFSPIDLNKALYQRQNLGKGFALRLLHHVTIPHCCIMSKLTKTQKFKYGPLDLYLCYCPVRHLIKAENVFLCQDFVTFCKKKGKVWPAMQYWKLEIIKRHAWFVKCCKILANSWVLLQKCIKQGKPIDRSFWKAADHPLLIQKYQKQDKGQKSTRSVEKLFHLQNAKQSTMTING